MKAFRRFAVLAAVAILSSAAFHACDGTNGTFLGIPIDADLINFTPANFGENLSGSCEGICDGDFTNDKQVTTFGATGSSDSTVTINLGAESCSYTPTGTESVDELETGLVAAVNGEDIDCGPDNVFVKATKGSVIVTGLFGGFFFSTGTEGSMETLTTVDRQLDSYSMADFLTDFGYHEGRTAVDELIDQVNGDDAWPDVGPFAFHASTTANCNDDGGGGDASGGTVTLAAAVRGEILEVPPATRIAPADSAPPDSSIDGMFYSLTFNSCELVDDIWGDGADDTVTVSGTTTLLAAFDPPIEGGGTSDPGSESIRFTGNLVVSTSENTSAVNLNSTLNGWDNMPTEIDGGFCFGGAVLFGADDEDSLDDNCTGNGTFIPMEFPLFGIVSIEP